MLHRFALVLQAPEMPDVSGAVVEALYRIPVVRFVLAVVSPEWRPLWALTWLVALVYAAMRAFEVVQRTAVRRKMAAQLAAERSPTRVAGETMGAATLPFEQPDAAAQPAPPGETADAAPRALALRAALVTAVAGTTLLLIGECDRADRNGRALGAVAETPIAAFDDSGPPPPLADEPEPFTFAARGWRMAGGACVATMEVTGASQPASTLTMFVMDGDGAVLGKDVIRVPSVTAGAFHEFRFPGVDCDAVAHWQVQG